MLFMATTHFSPAAGARAQAQRQVGNLPVYLAVVLGYLLLLPPQFNLSIGGSDTALSLLLIAASLYMMRDIVSGRLRFAWPDAAILAAVVWICLAMTVSSPTEVAFTGSIAHISDIGFSYFFARVVFRNLNDLRRFLVLILQP